MQGPCGRQYPSTLGQRHAPRSPTLGYQEYQMQGYPWDLGKVAHPYSAGSLCPEIDPGRRFWMGCWGYAKR
eukprot:6038153-Pyramimonas_sp.AAC.1